MVGGYVEVENAIGQEKVTHITRSSDGASQPFDRDTGLLPLLHIRFLLICTNSTYKNPLSETFSRSGLLFAFSPIRKKNL